MRPVVADVWYRSIRAPEMMTPVRVIVHEIAAPERRRNKLQSLFGLELKQSLLLNYVGQMDQACGW